MRLIQQRPRRDGDVGRFGPTWPFGRAPFACASESRLDGGVPEMHDPPPCSGHWGRVPGWSAESEGFELANRLNQGSWVGVLNLGAVPV